MGWYVYYSACAVERLLPTVPSTMQLVGHVTRQSKEATKASGDVIVGGTFENLVSCSIAHILVASQTSREIDGEASKVMLQVVPGRGGGIGMCCTDVEYPDQA